MAARTLPTLDYDVVIVGGGPAGLCAGLYCARAKLSTVILEKGVPGGQIVNTELVEDYPGFESILGPELASKMESHARKFGADLHQDQAAEIWSEDGGTYVLAEEALYRAKAVIVTAGGTPNKLGVPGEERLNARGVSYCAVCDGPFFNGQVLAVVGGGDAAVEEGHYLTRYATRLYLIHRRDRLRAQKILQERLLSTSNVEVLWNTVVEEIGGESRVDHLQMRNVVTGERSRLDVGGVFVFVGFRPNSDLFREPIARDAQGYIITNERMETTIEGIYAAGDVRTQLARQVTTAVGDATTAALAAEKYIEALKERHGPAAQMAATAAVHSGARCSVDTGQ